jgi:hypothetical protein
VRCRAPRTAPAAFAVLTALSLAVPTDRVEAQRRPGVGMGFFTTTALLTGDVEAGSVNSTTVYAEAPSFAGSVLVTGPLAKGRYRAWIVGARATVLSLGHDGGCYVELPLQGCQNRRFTERVAVLTGGAFDIRSTILRVMAGPALYQVESSGARVGTQLRLDLAAPRLRGPTPTLFVTRSFLGSQRGSAVGITTLGAGLRWVRKE